MTHGDATLPIPEGKEWEEIIELLGADSDSIKQKAEESLYRHNGYHLHHGQHLYKDRNPDAVGVQP